MIMVHITDNEEKLRQILSKMLSEIGNTYINIVKEEGVFKIMKKEDLLSEVSLADKVIELEDNLYRDCEGRLYEAVLERIELPLIQHILERTDGNQFKAARILGINRNTIRAKIKKLGIEPDKWKI